MRISDWSSDLCSSDLALRRVPGVSFQRDGLTGDGTNIMIRGLDPDMNAVKLNGLNLPVGNGGGRSAAQSNMLRSARRRVGTEWVTTCTSRWRHDHYNTNTQTKTQNKDT